MFRAHLIATQSASQAVGVVAIVSCLQLRRVFRKGFVAPSYASARRRRPRRRHYSRCRRGALYESVGGGAREALAAMQDYGLATLNARTCNVQRASIAA